MYQILPGEVKIYAIGKNVLPAGADSVAGFQQTSYNEEEYRNVLAQMAANRGKGDMPKVGSFRIGFGIRALPVGSR